MKFRICLVVLAIAVSLHARGGDDTDVTKIEKKLEETRAALHIPGCSLAIVKDDRVILSKGFGQRDIEKNLPATPQTLFAIGSCTKAFTTMLAAMAADDGKLSLDDSPKKHLPYFKLNDPDLDAQVVLRDMFCHRTGMGPTDLLWYTGVLNRQEVIRAAGDARPTAKLRQKWQYQNVMYSVGGECAAKSLGMSWEDAIAGRIFKPLRMSGSDTSVREMQRATDFSRGYEIDLDTHQPQLLPTRDLTNIAPAGAINSSADDMARWLRFLLSGGVIDGKRLVSQRRFDELITRQVPLGPSSGYAFGWLISDWHGHVIVSHAGGIDGFNAYVALMPDRRLGYVLLTNVSSSPLDATVGELIWSALGDPKAAASSQPSTNATTEPAANPKREVGRYSFEEVGMTIEIAWKDDVGHLVAKVPGQPQYTLINVGGRRYKFENPAGFFMTFRASAGDPKQSEMFLEQPHGNYTLPKESAVAPATQEYAGPHKELIGSYAKGKFRITIKPQDGKLVAIVPGQPTYTLTETDQKDRFTLPPAPPPFAIEAKRDKKSDAVTGLMIRQPKTQGDFEVSRLPDPPGVSTDELIQKVIDAAGGEANLRKHTKLSSVATLVMPTQAVTGTLTVRAAGSPDRFARHMEFAALGRTLGSSDEIFDGARGATAGTFFPTRPMSAAELRQARVLGSFYGPLDWKRLFQRIAVTGTADVAGEPCLTIELAGGEGDSPPITAYVSTRSYRLLQRDYTKSSGVGQSEFVVEQYADYRNVDGVLISFEITERTTSPGAGGETVTTIRVSEAKFDGDDVKDTVFRVPASR
jgi:CubicO group peptidase (beta-lactamase class C family)